MNYSRRPVRRAAVGVLAGTLALTGGAIVAGVSPANALPGFTADRLQGQDRFETAADIAVSTFGTADTVVLARSDDFPDALTGNYLAGINNAPLLLTESANLTDATSVALNTLNAQNVIIVGETAAVSDAVEADLVAQGYNVRRLGGLDRYQTAERIANDAFGDGVGTVGAYNGLTTAVLGSGQNFPDVLAAGPLSFAQQFPITITFPTDLPQETINVYADLGIEQVIVVGGTDAVSQSVRDQVETLTGNPVVELAGQTRAGTAVAIADFAYDNLGFDTAHVNLARSEDFADALAGGPHGGTETAPIVITASGTLSTETEDFLAARAPTLDTGNIFGGTAAVSTAVEDAAVAAAQTVTTNQTLTVTPAEAATLSRVANPDTTIADDRQYTVNGLDSTKSYVVALFSGADTQTDGNGVVTFDDANSNNVADPTAPAADITVANGAAQPGSTSLVTVAPVNGTITFTVDGDTANETVVPVIWLDSVVGGTSVLNLTIPGTVNNNPKTPAEAFGIGGAVTFAPPAGTTGDIGATDVAITGVDKTVNTITTAAFLYSYDENDTFYVRTTDSANNADNAGTPAEQVLFATFEAAVSAGDELDASTFYQATAGLPSTFVLENLSPAAPGATVLLASNTTISFTVTGVVTGATVTVACLQPGNNSAYSAATHPVRGTNTADDDSVTAGYQITATGLTAGTDTDCYVLQTIGGETSAPSTRVDTATTAVAAAPAPISTATSVTDAGTGNATNLLDGSDMIQVQFDRATTMAANASLTLTDPDGSVGTVTCGSNATCSISTASTPVATITMTGPVAFSNIGGTPGMATGGATVVSSQTGFTNSAGGWNLAKSGVVGGGGKRVLSTIAQTNANMRNPLFTTVTDVSVGTSRISATGGTNEVQSLSAGTGTAGTFTLSFNGAPTGALAFNASAGAIQAALEGLSTIGTGNVTAAGGPVGNTGTAVTITFVGELAAGNVPQTTIDNTGITGTGGVMSTTNDGIRAVDLAVGDSVTVYNSITGASLGSAVVPAFGPTVVTLTSAVTAGDVVHLVAKGITDLFLMETETLPNTVQA